MASQSNCTVPHNNNQLCAVAILSAVLNTRVDSALVFRPTQYNDDRNKNIAIIAYIRGAPTHIYIMHAFLIHI